MEPHLSPRPAISGSCSRDPGDDVPLTLSDIEASLTHPPVIGSIATLRRMWEQEWIRFVCARPPDFQDHPELPVRIRGAFGRRLFADGSAVDRRGAQRPRAYDGLFEPLPGVPARLELGKPFVIRAWSERDLLAVELRLFGMAQIWKHEAVAAMLGALEGGVAVQAGGSLRVPLRVLDIVTRQEPISGLEYAPRSAALSFRTPVSVRHRNEHVTHPASVVRSILSRVESLARWHGIALEHDRQLLSHAVDHLALDDRALLPHRWSRHSIRCGDVAIGMMGQLGSLRIAGDLAMLTDYLLIAQTCNTGSHAAMGLGWFDLACYP